MDLYSHQEQEGLMVKNSFLFVHDDTFGRQFNTEEELTKYFEGHDRVDVSVISKTRRGYINVFLVKVTEVRPLNSEEELFKLSYYFEMLDEIRYYTVLPVDFNLVKES